MKHRTLLIFFFALALAFQTNAQFSFGVKAEIGTTHAPSDEYFAASKENFISYRLAYQNSSPIKSFGVFAQFESGPLFIQPELVYSSSKNFFTVQSFISDDPNEIEFDERNESIDLVMIGGLKFHNFRIGVGPSFHFNMGKESDLATMERFEYRDRSLSTGFNFGLGYDLGRISLDVKYENTFSRVGDYIFVENQKSKINSSINTLKFSIGVKI